MLTSEQILQKYGKAPTTLGSGNAPAPAVQAPQGNVGRFIDDFKAVLSRTAGDVGKEFDGVFTRKLSGTEGLQKGANIAGKLAGGIGDLVFGTTMRAGFHALPQDSQTALKQNVGQLAQDVGVPQVMQAYGGFKEAHPQLAQNVENLANIASLVPGNKVISKGLEVASGAGKKTLTTLGNVVKEAGTAKVIARRMNELTKLESRNASLRKVIQSSTDKGIDVKKIVAETDLLKGAVDKSGAIRTTQEGGAVSMLQDFIKPQEKVISKVLKEDGQRINLSIVEQKLKDTIYKSGVEGGALTRALKNVDDDIAGYALKADAQGSVPLSLIQDAKIDKYRNVNYLVPESKRVDKAIAKGLKEIVEENMTSANAKALNKELEKHYATLGFLEKLDGKVVAGGKLGKYFASTVGAVAGSHFGPLGAVMGAEIGSALKGASMARKFGGTTGKVLQQSDEMINALRPISPKPVPAALPVPKQLGPGALITPTPKDTSRLFTQTEAKARLSELSTGQAPKPLSVLEAKPASRIKLQDNDLHNRVMNEITFAKAGERYRTGDGGFSGSKSTFPDWIPQELRHKDLLDAVSKHIQEGTLPTNKTLTRLYRIVEDEMNALDDVINDAKFMAQQRQNVVVPFASDAENAAALAKFDAEVAKLKSKT